MAVVETIRIDGDSSQFDASIKELIANINQLNKSIDKVGTEAKQSFGQAEDAVKGVKEEVKETGKGIKDLVRNFGSLALLTKATDAASEAFTQNQKVVDVLNTGLFTVQIAVSNLIDYFTGGKSSLREALSGVIDQAKELVELQKQAQLAEVQRIKLQFEYQTLAEQARQLRDDELLSIDERLEANRLLNDILTEQLAKEKEAVGAKIAAAQAEYNRIANTENLVALEQARVELIDIEERIIGQTSEYLMNQRSLERERLDLQKQINEQKALEAETGVRNTSLSTELEIRLFNFRVQNERELAEEEFSRYEKAYQIRVDFLNQQIAAAQAAGQTENAQYQALLDEKYQLDVEYFDRNRDLAEQRRQLNLQSVSDAVQTTQQAISAISAFYDARYANDEKNAEKAFNIQKKLSIAQAVVQGIESVQNAYATAQKSPLTAVFPAYPVVAAGTAAAFAASQVALINSQQYQSTGASSYDSGATAPSVPSQPAQFNIVGQGGANQLVEGIAGQFDRPIRAYVVSGEVISGAELDRRRIRTATFG
jgi:hypothetical protein